MISCALEIANAPQIGDAPSHGSKPPPARASLRHASVPRLGATESPLLVVVVVGERETVTLVVAMACCGLIRIWTKVTLP